MFLGHFAVGLAAKKVAPRTSLATLFAAAQLVDLVWPVLVLLGVESLRVEPGNTAFTPLDFVHYPWTHSLLMAVAWGAAFGLLYRARTGYKRGAFAVTALVGSHWLLDLLTHRPDLPLVPGLSTKVGLGLWNSVPGTVVVELSMFAAGLAVYLSATRARNRRGALALWALVAVFLLIYVGNLTQVPPGPVAVASSALGMWLFVLWGWWIDRNREARGEPAPSPS
ncbi:MAG TPA: metal-dependent hydrolase [Anaeromyxobacteraceae bacterium]|nr:metal-dependent hydrolase [Anaeromyxobacteraceae bacterium]